MKIVFLDAYTVGPQDLDLSELKGLGDFKMYDRTGYSQTLERCKGASVVLTNKAILDESIISNLPELKYIGVTATGYNVVDLAAAKKNGVVVTNAKNYSSISVAQHVFALLLSFSNRIAEHNNANKWINSPDFCYYDFSLMELEGKTMGLIGIGDIGEKVAQLAEAFGMQVLVNRKSDNPHPIFKTVDLETLLACSDVVSLHCPQTPENTGFMNAGLFKKMKANAILINTARGPLINEKDLAQALNQNIIGGAALDVLSKEPPSNGNPIFEAKNLVLSPHVAWATLEARKRLMQIVTDNIKAWQRGLNINVVS